MKYVGIGDPETILVPLASYLRPMLLNSLKERRKAAFTQNAQRMKRVLDNLQHKIDEVISAVANVPHSLSIIFFHGKK